MAVEISVETVVAVAIKADASLENVGTIVVVDIVFVAYTLVALMLCWHIIHW